jgi:hypothetical protein
MAWLGLYGMGRESQPVIRLEMRGPEGSPVLAGGRRQGSGSGRAASRAAHTTEGTEEGEAAGACPSERPLSDQMWGRVRL